MSDDNKNSTSNTAGAEDENRLWSAERMQQAIQSYLNKKMSAREQDEFWAQLVEQPDYYKYLRLEASLKKLHREKGEQLFSDSSSPGPDDEEPAPDSSGFRLHSYTSWIIAVAAVSALVIAVNLMRVSGPLGSRAQPDPIASAEGITPPLGTIDALYFESIDGFRDEISGEEFTQLFDEGLLAAFSGDTEKALRIYEQLLQEFPEDERTAMVQLNAGIIKYNAEAYEAAGERFESALRLAELHDDLMLQEKALWFTANAQLQNGHIQAAFESLTQVIAFHGSFESEAQELQHMIQPYIEE